MKKRLVAVSLIGMCMVAGAAQAAGDVAAGQAKAALCIACHGPDGNSPNPIWPKLAAQHPSYLKKQLMSFKSGERKDPLMSPIAAQLSEADVDNLTAFFTTQKQSGGTAAADKVALGEAIYRGGNIATGVAACNACHGPTGMGLPSANFPRISGQHAKYVAKALQDFRSGSRTTDPNWMMRGIAGHMSDAEIEAVAEYVQGLKR